MRQSKLQCVTILIALFLSSACADESADEWDTEEALAAGKKYTAATIELLGLSPYAVKWLLDASPTSIHLYENLKQEGAVRLIRQLEDKGLVEFEVSGGAEKYARIIPTSAGIAFQKSTRADIQKDG